MAKADQPEVASIVQLASLLRHADDCYVLHAQDVDSRGFRAAEQQLQSQPELLAEEVRLHQQFGTYGCQGSSKQLKPILLPLGNTEGVTTTFNTTLVHDPTPHLLVMLRPLEDVIRKVTTELAGLWERKKELNEAERERLKECQAMCLFALYGREASRAMKVYRHDWAAEVARLQGKSDIKDFHHDFQVRGKKPARLRCAELACFASRNGDVTLDACSCQALYRKPAKIYVSRAGRANALVTSFYFRRLLQELWEVR